MYVNLKKIIKVFGLIIALIIIGFGIFSYVVGLSAQQQTVGALTAIFGLQFGWFVLWLTRG